MCSVVTDVTFYRASETESCLPKVANISIDTSSTFSLTTHQRIGIYGGIVAFAVFVVTMRAVLCYLVILAASRSLHSKMLTAILRAPILFFDTNPVGEYFTVVYTINIGTLRPFCILFMLRYDYTK